MLNAPYDGLVTGGRYDHRARTLFFLEFQSQFLACFTTARGVDSNV